ncbi:MAG: hypothetical protein EOO68_23520 [Moraxellaceae bacterium]|nr:MAG: hypothetical protein EOO68_23520 [Moraxellaceae bacterium]
MKNFSIILTTLFTLIMLNASASPDIRSAADKKLTPAEIQKCKEDGGVVKNVGMMEIPKCVIAYPDAGKPCKSSSDCTKSCVVMKSGIEMGTKISGECQRDNALYGCYTIVEEGVAGPSMCAD